MRRPSRKRFHQARLVAWSLQLPLLFIEGVRESVPYLAFLSLAALIESAATDVDQSLKDEEALRSLEAIKKQNEEPSSKSE